ncbi:MAG: hypothetical protein J0L69_07685 [Bacteroidetes bacterium]|nr:hypothetical protein [Bacteroidota bacterium]
MENFDRNLAKVSLETARMCVKKDELLEAYINYTIAFSNADIYSDKVFILKEIINFSEEKYHLDMPSIEKLFDDLFEIEENNADALVLLLKYFKKNNDDRVKELALEIHIKDYDGKIKLTQEQYEVVYGGS